MIVGVHGELIWSEQFIAVGELESSNIQGCMMGTPPQNGARVSLIAAQTWLYQVQRHFATTPSENQAAIGCRSPKFHPVTKQDQIAAEFDRGNCRIGL